MLKTAFSVFVFSERTSSGKAGAPGRFSGRPPAFLLPPLLLTLLLFSSCAGTTGGARAGGNDFENPVSRVLRKVPFYPQADHQCGPASMAEVLDYYGSKATPESIAASIYSKTAKGTLGIDMLIYPGRAGFKARQYSGSKRDIRKEIDLGRPLIVFVDYGFWVYQRGHFMVVAGYDSNGPVVHSVDGPFEHIPWDEFMGPWNRTGRWTLLITPGKNKNTPAERANQ